MPLLLCWDTRALCQRGGGGYSSPTNSHAKQYVISNYKDVDVNAMQVDVVAVDDDDDGCQTVIVILIIIMRSRILHA